MSKEIEGKIRKLNSEDELKSIIPKLRVVCANNKSIQMLENLEVAIEKCKNIGNKKLFVDLLELEIKQLYQDYENLERVDQLLVEMEEIAHKINYKGGLALVAQIRGYVEFFRGNRKESSEEIKKAIEIIKTMKKQDPYVRNVCYYSYAISTWLEHREINSIKILEDCIDYFLFNGYYHSLGKGIGVLLIILQRSQKRKKARYIVEKMLDFKASIKQFPQDVLGVLDLFVGFYHKLSLNLNLAEKYLTSAKNNLKLISKNSKYLEYYLFSLSNIAAILALQGKIRMSLNQIKQVEELLDDYNIINKIDNQNKRQAHHTLNLTKFYVNTKSLVDKSKQIKTLRKEILNRINKCYSNPIMLTEFLLNSKLTLRKLLKLRKSENISVKGVEHILNYLIEKRKLKYSKEKAVDEYIKILNTSKKNENQTFLEEVQIDLLIAQELFDVKEYAEIYAQLRKYEKILNAIEALEMRTKMEGFLELGKFAIGDVLAPGKQYATIIRSRENGFKKLEKKLLEQQQLMKKWAIRRIRRS
ncbi:MAG: hypothetical protein ACTSSG_08290 [Candidatus Heimdallarchaeaceae archaeon]